MSAQPKPNEEAKVKFNPRGGEAVYIVRTRNQYTDFKAFINTHRDWLNCFDHKNLQHNYCVTLQYWEQISKSEPGACKYLVV